jgi:preprotein translocase YajC subunit
MINSLAKGDIVLTNGGIYGTVESFDKEKGVVSVAVAPKVSIKFARSAITSVTRKKDKSEGDGAAAD